MKKLITLLLTFIACISCYAITGKEVIQSVLDVKDPDFTHSMVQMDLVEKSGAVETRAVEQYGRSINGLESIVMVFKTPAAVRDTRFLQVENDGRDDDKWIYMPALRSTRRIASSEGDKSFMGTDATYDDMSERKIDEDTHELISEEAKNGFDCYKVQSTPVDAKTSQYKYRMQWIDKKTLLPIYVELYDKKGKLEKVLQVKEIKAISGYNIPMNNEIMNVQTGHSTRLIIRQIELDKPIPDKLFSTNFLNTGRLN